MVIFHFHDYGRKGIIGTTIFKRLCFQGFTLSLQGQRPKLDPVAQHGTPRATAFFFLGGGAGVDIT